MSKLDKQILNSLGKFTLTEVKVNPKDLVIVTNKNHVLYQDRANWPVDEQLVKDIQNDGFNSIIIIGTEFDEQINAEQTLVVAGRQRTKAAIEAGLKEIPAYHIGNLVDYSKSELQALMVKENERRKDNNTLDKAKEALRLYNTKLDEAKPSDWPSEVEWKPGKDVKAGAVEFVAQVFGLSVPRIYMLFKLLDEDRTSAGLLKAISGKDPEINMNGALKLSKLNPIEQEEALAKLRPVIAKKEAEAKADPTGKKKRAASSAEVEAVVNKNAVIKLQRSELERTRARRSCPSDVKDYIKHLLNPGSIELAYLPGRLEPVKEKPLAVEDEE